MLEELQREVHDLRARLNELGGHLDYARKEAEIQRLEEEASAPNLWEDPERARTLLQKLNQAKEAIEPYQRLQRRIEDLEAYGELLAEQPEPDAAALREFETETKKAVADIERLELETLLSGEHDVADAIIEIEAGAGGTDACDWVTMLQRMYLKWAETHGYTTEIVEESEADVAGLKSTTFLVHGRNAYGYLKSERGVHRLVRISPFDANKRRQTSFARVIVLPDLGEEVEVEIAPEDLRIDYYRSSGAGGQHVNKTESAVRITHIPTGIVVTCQNERSQHQNRAVAMQVLRARLYDLQQQQQQQRIANLRGVTKANEWGNQDRSYVLHPYTLVKDHRTGYETSDVNRVLNGEIDDFLQAYLQWLRRPVEQRS
ncbi:peptide chain release factor 2 [Chthonomonas calidirosea]|uniref:peptide chain release factor 2 n=1 Tax=Chthonomonas calidirosea TaxID=454171 RepID=UPI0012DFB623|nr:peptide chain release factor 2 [Chthonomonas calidirosea]